MCADYDSNFGSESEAEDKRSRKRLSQSDTTVTSSSSSSFKKPRPPKSEFVDESDKNERKLRFNFQAMDAYSRHKLLINEYVLTHPGSTAKLARNTSRDKTEYEVLKDNHRFIWEDESLEGLSWGQRLAKKYYNQLFKEYCISDLSRYKENKFGMRWRTEREVLDGRGQFSCGAVRCANSEELRTWEVFFSYQEMGEQKGALVKLRLCPDCSTKLNYRHKRREVKRRKKSGKSQTKEESEEVSQELCSEAESRGSNERREATDEVNASSGTQIWSKPQPLPEVEKPIDDEFDEYLEDLLL